MAFKTLNFEYGRDYATMNAAVKAVERVTMGEAIFHVIFARKENGRITPVFVLNDKTMVYANRITNKGFTVVN